jgi:hypothetical protein
MLSIRVRNCLPEKVRMYGQEITLHCQKNGGVILGSLYYIRIYVNDVETYLSKKGLIKRKHLQHKKLQMFSKTNVYF